jgi:hypothetical protein
MTYFGKGCEYLSTQWEDQDDKSGSPVLVYCNSIFNTDPHEGNCNEKRCPYGYTLTHFQETDKCSSKTS